jgi:polysaccharide export outer membrane protein
MKRQGLPVLRATWALWFFAAVGMAGCTINKDIMFQTPEDFAFDDIQAIVKDTEYRIAPNDFITVQVFSNEGQRLLAATAGSTEGGGQMNLQMMQQQQQQGGVRYLVKPDGHVELPEIGDIALTGMTLQEAEKAVERAYSSLYHAPYALIRVTNNRVFVFPGQAGAATIVPLENMNTTVLEVLARAGGIAPRGNASQVKLIRKIGDRNHIFHMDLSTIDGMQAANTTVQAYDVIYVEPVPELANEVLRDLSPIMSIISSLSILWALLSNAI